MIPRIWGWEKSSNRAARLQFWWGSRQGSLDSRLLKTVFWFLSGCEMGPENSEAPRKDSVLQARNGRADPVSQYS